MIDKEKGAVVFCVKTHEEHGVKGIKEGYAPPVEAEHNRDSAKC